MRFSKSDFFIVLAVLGLSALSLSFFLSEVNANFSRDGEGRLGTVSFRKNAATRRSAATFRWEGLKDGADVFSGDTLRTSGMSEASVFFDDGASLDVLENSMLRLAGTASADIEMEGGAIHLSGGTGRSRRVRTGSSVVELAPGSDVSLLSGKDTLVVDVTAGNASVKTGNAAPRSVVPGDVLQVDLKTGVASVSHMPVTPLFPAQGARLVSLDGADRMEFRVRSAGELPEGSYLEVAPDSSFRITDTRSPLSGLTRDASGLLSVAVPVAPGVRYWRVAAPSLAVSPIRRFHLAVSSAPSPTWPADAETLSYRKALPSIRFSWGASPEASGYTLEISRVAPAAEGTRRIRTSITSQVVQDLPEGEWRWRVIPEYGGSTIGTVVPSPYRSFSIVKSASMEPVAPIAPLDGKLYALKSFAASGLVFSWKSAGGAAGYEFRVYDSASASQPVATFRTASPWLRLDSKTAPFLLGGGKRFWAVAWIDTDGTISSECGRRVLVGVDEQIAVRAFAPCDGYLASASSVESLRFAWKSNVGAKTKLLVSSDSAFQKNDFEIDADGTSAVGVALPVGEWFWKVRLYNVDGAAFIDTAARRLRVIESLGSPRLVAPATLPEIVAREGDPVELAWSSVDDAEFYSCAVYSPEVPLRPVFTRERIDGTSVWLPAGTLASGSYRIELRAFAESSERSARLFGETGSTSVSVRSLSRMVLLRPSNGAAIDAVSAWKNGVRLEWRSSSVPDSLALSVRKDGALYPVRLPSYSVSAVVLPRLSPGYYRWTTVASCSGLDISPRSAIWFRVLPPEPLSAPSALSPVDGSSLDAGFFSARKGILFSWAAVPDAAFYRLKIFAMPGRRLVASVDRLASTSYLLSDLRCLDRGEFVWEISAEDPSGKNGPQRAGKVSSARFSVTLPRLETPKSAGNPEFYAY